MSIQASSRIFYLDADPAGAGQHDITDVCYGTCHSELGSESRFLYHLSLIFLRFRLGGCLAGRQGMTILEKSFLNLSSINFKHSFSEISV